MSILLEILAGKELQRPFSKSYKKFVPQLVAEQSSGTQFLFKMLASLQKNEKIILSAIPTHHVTINVFNLEKLKVGTLKHFLLMPEVIQCWKVS